MDKVPLTIIACCILHNICIDIRDDVDVDPEHDEPDELLPLPGHVNSEGQDKGGFFSNLYLFNEQFYQQSTPVTITLVNQT